MLDDIRNAIDSAAKGQKVATFNLQVLVHATELEGLEPEAFCRAVGVTPAGYKTEFRKMLKLARLMDERGLALRLRHG